MNTIKLPLTYRALVIERPGAPVSLQQKTISALGNDEVLVRVAYASVNKMDPFLAIQNIFNLPAPYVLGFDFSGEIILAGDSERGSFQVGDAVFGRLLGGGGFAEYVIAKKENIGLREELPAREASTYGIAYLTAYESLVVTGKVEHHSGKWIYVAGAAGGVGHFAAQIAKLFGLKVIGSAGKPASLELLHQLHLDHVIDYSKQDVVKEIMALTDGKGVDLVYDSTYQQSSYIHSTGVVASGGEYIRLGTLAQLAQTGAQDMTTAVEARGAKMTIGDFGRYSNDPDFQPRISKVNDGMKQAVKWYVEGKLKPLITQTVPFDAKSLQQTFESFLKGTNNLGKIVVKCGQ